MLAFHNFLHVCLESERVKKRAELKIDLIQKISAQKLLRYSQYTYNYFCTSLKYQLKSSNEHSRYVATFRIVRKIY